MTRKIQQLLSICFFTYPRLSFILTMIIIFSSLLELPLPLLTVYFIDNVLKGTDYKLLNMVGFSLVSFLIISNLISYVKTYLNTKLTELLHLHLSLTSFESLMASSYNNQLSQTSGYWLNRIQNEPQSIVALFRTTIDIFTTIITFLMGLYFIFHYNIKLAFFILLILPLYIYSLKIMTPKIRSLSAQLKEKRSLISGWLEESINGFESIKILVLEEFKTNEIKSNWKGLIESNLKMSKLISLNNLLSSLVLSFAPIGVLWYGGYLVMLKQLSLGQLIGINKFLGYIFRPVSSLISINSQIQDAITSFDRLNEIVKFQKENNSDNIYSFKVNDDIVFNNISFGYSKDLIFHNFNLEIKGGITTAIIGKSGCGKSTLIKLVVGFNKIKEGNIYVGHFNISNIDLYSLRKQVNLIPQNVFLFSNSLEYNILLDLENKDDNQKLFQTCGLDSYLLNHFDKKDYTLGNKGLRLSGGQRQRIALARSLLREPKILIMDEVTSEIDLVTENQIINDLIQLRKGKTTVIVAHSISSVRKADEIIILGHNSVIDRGTHKELLLKKNFYSQIWSEMIENN